MAIIIPLEIIRNEDKEAVIDAAQEYLECDQIICYEDKLVVGGFLDILWGEPKVLDYLGISYEELMADGRLTEPSNFKLDFDIRKAIALYEEKGRLLTESEINELRKEAKNEGD